MASGRGGLDNNRSIPGQTHSAVRDPVKTTPSDKLQGSFNEPVFLVDHL